ncbi:ATP-binding protein [Chryseolinea lacunae]|uniref:ATP-binding protein n=1 Tax=Chryseolinea lacunae TaxID=2801331 RepID=A0ABS1KZ88_9BACT|nr:AAA family ATPase [Chryseolinea lacunae]MBL0744587.1 ATP-binding protein [Chryseolinea lacunae]
MLFTNLLYSSSSEASAAGKTTVVTQFAASFEQYIYLNLELPDDRQPFEQFTTIAVLLQAVFFLKNKSLSQRQYTLLFIDEIQAAPEAMNILRYFHEEAPDIAVIAAGSMLETLFNKNVSFPVGRVEYKVLRPASFPEFLSAMNETAAREQLQHVPAESFAHRKLLALFHTYALIGGMPEAVQHYSTNKDLVSLAPIYDSLLTSYIDDVEKYARNDSQMQIIRHAIRASFAQAGKRIKYQGFGNSSYGSRDMGEALRALQKALLLYLVFPDTGYTLPLLPDLKKSPRLHVLDTGLMNYFAAIQKEILSTDDLNKVYQGNMIEHMIGQELLAFQHDALSALHFWVREKKTSVAEVDYLFPFEGRLIPIEVKSGTTGTLRSLHQFMDATPHDLAVRFYAGEVSVADVVTPNGKSFSLLNLPYYAVSQLEKYLTWMLSR